VEENMVAEEDNLDRNLEDYMSENVGNYYKSLLHRKDNLIENHQH
jgi:hypothetical protein